MKCKIILTLALAFLADCSIRAQSILQSGDSITWQFQLQYESTSQINSPDQAFGGFVILDYTYLSQAGPLDYRLDFFEDSASTTPILSLPVHHLTGLEDQTGMPLIWLPEFSAPSGAWSDLNGALRLTIISGEMRAVTPYISLLTPSTPGYMDNYEAVLVPEPSIACLIGTGALLFSAFKRKQKIR